MPESDDQTLAGPDLAGPEHEPSTDATVAAEIGLSRPPSRSGQPRVVAPRIGRFSILRKLGAGGMGVVYAGYDEELDRKVAIKLLHERGQSLARRQRLLREAQGLARLSHQNVVQVYEIGEHQASAFIAMEFVEGGTLGEWLAQERRSRWAILDVFIQAGRGLAAAHKKGLVHRDFKPDNVMIASEGRVVVMDFGLVHEVHTEAGVDEGEASEAAPARVAMNRSQVEADAIELSLRSSVLSSDLTLTGAMMGTPAYMAPEQFAGQPTDARSDQFSYAVAVWEALCGERPFAGETVVELCTAVVGGQRREPPRGADLPAYLRKILVRALATAPAQRWPSMDELLAALAVDHARRRRIALAIVAPLVLLAGLGLGRQRQQAAALAEGIQECERHSAAIEQVWSPERQSRIAAAFVATESPLAGDAWARAQARLDDYAREWATLRRESCRAATIERSRAPAMAARADACLSERLAAFGSFVELLEQPDTQLITRAVSGSAELPLVRLCADERWLAHRVEPPADPQQRERIAALRGRIERVTVLRGMARFDEGKAEADAVLAEAEALAWPPLLAEAQFARSSFSIKLGDPAAAEVELEQAFFGAGEAGHDVLALWAAINSIQVVGVKLERADEGLRWARIAAMLVARLELSGSTDEAWVASSLGDLHVHHGHLDLAEAEYRRALALMEAAYGSEHPYVASVLNGLGIVQRRLGQLDEGLATQARALAIREASLGPQHPTTGDTVGNLGVLALHLDKLDEALAYTERALVIFRAAYGEDNRKIGFAYNILGSVHLARGEHDKALDYQRRAQAVWEKVLGPEHSTVALALAGVAKVLLAEGQLDDALTMQRRALSLTETLGDEHTYLAERLVEHAAVLAALGQFDEALIELERALAIRTKAKLEPRLVAEVHFELAQNRWALGEHEAARAQAGLAAQLCGETGTTCANYSAWLRER